MSVLCTQDPVVERGEGKKGCASEEHSDAVAWPGALQKRPETLDRRASSCHPTELQHIANGNDARENRADNHGPARRDIDQRLDRHVEPASHHSQTLVPTPTTHQQK